VEVSENREFPDEEKGETSSVLTLVGKETPRRYDIETESDLAHVCSRWEVAGGGEVGNLASK
jgi:hypothetical protein